MIKSYRKRFILSNMLLSGIVLLAVFIVLGVVSCNQEYRNLENTMSLVLKPWNSNGLLSANGQGYYQDKKPEPSPKKETSGEPERKKEPEPHEREEEKGQGGEISQDDYELFTTVIYHSRSKEVSILSGEEAAESETIEAAAAQAAKESKRFGKLPDHGLIYYKENTKIEIKIALISTSYLTAKIAKRLLLLTLVFLLSMGAIFAVSVRLAKLAAKPLEQAIEMERNFVADISHDLKTPITIVLANNGILKSNKNARIGEQLQWIESTETAAKNMMELVNEMLTLSEVESFGRKAELYSVPLSSVCEKCTLQLESLAYEQNIGIVSDIAEDIEILSTHEYTERICSGLIDNALKYEHSGGRIEVNVFKDKKNAVLTVRNFGSVISEEDMPHIFERFYRADKTRGQTKGHGLGLPIIKQMTELIGAKIDVKSSQSDGTVFTVRFDMPD